MTNYHYTSIIYVSWTEIKNTKYWWGHGESGSHTVLVGMKNGTGFLENSLAVLLKKLNKIAHLSIYSREMKIYVHTKTCTWMFIALLLLVVKNWNSPDVLLTSQWWMINSEWLNKPWYTHIIGMHENLDEFQGNYT